MRHGAGRLRLDRRPAYPLPCQESAGSGGWYRVGAASLVERSMTRVLFLTVAALVGGMAGFVAIAPHGPALSIMVTPITGSAAYALAWIVLHLLGSSEASRRSRSALYKRLLPRAPSFWHDLRRLSSLLPPLITRGRMWANHVSGIPDTSPDTRSRPRTNERRGGKAQN